MYCFVVSIIYGTQSCQVVRNIYRSAAFSGSVGIVVLWGLPHVCLWVWDRYEDWNPIRQQPCLFGGLPPPLDNIRVMAILWRLRGNIIRTALYWVVWHSVHSRQHTHMSSSYRSSRLGLSHWDPYAMRRCDCLELYYCNMVEWSWWDSSLIWKTKWFPSVLWHCWFGHMTCKNRPRNDL